jgi:hypothetical protein
MDHYFVDQKSKRIFCLPPSLFLNQLPHEALIQWCAQYLSPQTILLDCDANIGAFSVLLSGICQQVVAFEKTSYLTHTTKVNNIKNIKIINHQKVDSLTCFPVGLVVIQNHVDIYLNNMMITLNNNKFPPVVYYQPNNHVQTTLTLLGYTVYPIGGCSDWFLASDHPKHKKTIEEYDNIIVSPTSSPQVVESTLIQSFSSMTKLPFKTCIMLHCPMSHERVPNNPSIVKVKNDYLCHIRASNYVYEPQFRFLDGGQIHKSDHYLLTLNNDFCITKTIKLIDKTNNIYYPSFVEGIDDLRLINDYMFLCSHGQFSPTRVIKQCLGHFNHQGEVTSLIPLKGPHEMRHEKNWLPLIKNDMLFVIYTLDPFVLYQVNKENGDLTLIKNEKLTTFNLNLRGSAPPVPYKNGYLMTAHHSCQSVMNYFHRFVWIDDNFSTIKWSHPFYFDIQGIEFNCGLTLSQEGVILTHSVWDNFARLKVIDYQVVDDLLQI